VALKNNANPVTDTFEAGAGTHAQLSFAVDRPLESASPPIDGTTF